MLDPLNLEFSLLFYPRYAQREQAVIDRACSDAEAQFLIHGVPFSCADVIVTQAYAWFHTQLFESYKHLRGAGDSPLEAFVEAMHPFLDLEQDVYVGTVCIHPMFQEIERILTTGIDHDDNNDSEAEP